MSTDFIDPTNPVVALCAAGMAAEGTPDEARRLLPADYPYFAESTELAEACRVLRRVTETFGKDDWQYASAAMSAIDCYRPERILASIESMMQILDRRG